MVEITLTNTRTRTKEVLVPLNPDDVRMYLCGPTVYDRAHLGNARPVVVFDVLYRLLRHVYGEDHVTYVRNFTDVDDKINAAALARQQAGDPRRLEDLIRERTIQTIGWYHDDMDALGALRPSIRGAVSDRAEPRATDYVPQMIAMIEDLVAKGHAYAAQGHVLFDVRSFPAYGRLSGRSIDDMIAGARVEVAPFKRDPMDFVLWKPSSAAEPGWDSPWGRGRPGWHIECSAMSAALLGDSFDIHAGGIDLQFPHHENEIAQSCCAHPKAEFAKVWLHNEMLQVEGKKMSKSLGNFFTVRDLLDQGVPGEVIRYVFLMTHYRKPMDWTAEKVREAEVTLRKWRDIAGDAKPSSKPADTVVAALADDIGTPGALAALHEIAARGDGAVLKASAGIIGLLLEQPEVERIPEEAQRLFLARVAAREQGDYVLSDGLRAWLNVAGFNIEDRKPHAESVLRRDTEAEFDGWQRLGNLMSIGHWLAPASILRAVGSKRGVEFEEDTGAVLWRRESTLPPPGTEPLREALELVARRAS